MSPSFSDVSDRIGISAIDGYLAAFGDFNADKKTDLFVVTNGGKRQLIFNCKIISWKGFNNLLCRLSRIILH